MASKTDGSTPTPNPQTVNDVTPTSLGILSSVRRTESSLKKPTTNFSTVYVRVYPDPRGPNVAGYTGSSCRPLSKLNYFLVVTIDRLCGLVVRVSGYRCRGLGFDSRRYQIF